MSAGGRHRPKDKEALLKLLEEGFPKQLKPCDPLTDEDRESLRQAISGELDSTPDRIRALLGMVARFEPWKQAYIELTVGK
jgi:hypothetical protein